MPRSSLSLQREACSEWLLKTGTCPSANPARLPHFEQRKCVAGLATAVLLDSLSFSTPVEAWPPAHCAGDAAADGETVTVLLAGPLQLLPGETMPSF